MTQYGAESLETRLIKYAAARSVPSHEVMSIKFRPAKAGEQWTDECGRQYSDAYMYGSEYDAAERQVALRPSAIITDVKELQVGSTGWWRRWFELGLGRRPSGPSQPRPETILWIPHETGLELVTLAIASAQLGVAVAALYITIWNAVQNSTNAPQRPYKADHVRLEVRHYASGKLVRRTIVSIPISGVCWRTLVNKRRLVKQILTDVEQILGAPSPSSRSTSRGSGGIQ